VKERQVVARIVRRIQSAQTKNTAIRFRCNSLNQRFLSFQSYWNRTVREIYAGTYHRDLARVERDMKKRGIDMTGYSKLRSKGELEAALLRSLAEAAQQEAASAALAAAADSATGTNGAPVRAVREFTAAEKAALLTGELRIVSTTAPPPIPKAASQAMAKNAPPPTPKAVPPPVPAAARRPTAPADAGARAAAAASAATDDRMKRLYQAYVSAKKRTGEPTDGLTYDRLVRTLQKQVPSIQAKTGCKRVDFKIEIKQGKAILKAVPVK
jgi:hypothetical protein